VIANMAARYGTPVLSVLNRRSGKSRVTLLNFRAAIEGVDFADISAFREEHMSSSRGLLGCALLIAFSVVPACAQAPGGQAPARGRGPAGPGLTLTSPDFPDGGVIPAKFTQADPKPVSPELDWTNVPQGTVSFVLLLHDPDTALQRKSDDVLHWLVFNIPGTAHQLAQGQPADAQLPDGTIQAKNLRGGVGFMGPGAPAAGPDHHYTFELFALDEKLDLGPDATRAQVMDAIQGHILGKGVLVGRFHRPQ
jgi:Raf kinase inhibitor-like YbhB/YbcL family protein